MCAGCSSFRLLSMTAVKSRSIPVIFRCMGFDNCNLFRFKILSRPTKYRLATHAWVATHSLENVNLVDSKFWKKELVKKITNYMYKKQNIKHNLFRKTCSVRWNINYESNHYIWLNISTYAYVTITPYEVQQITLECRFIE